MFPLWKIACYADISINNFAATHALFRVRLERIEILGEAYHGLIRSDRPGTQEPCYQLFIINWRVLEHLQDQAEFVPEAVNTILQPPLTQLHRMVTET
jgi:hypothetical protein